MTSAFLVAAICAAELQYYFLIGEINMKAYWDEQNHKLVFDLEGQEIRGNFTKPISESDIMILNGIFFNTATKVKSENNQPMHRTATRR